MPVARTPEVMDEIERRISDGEPLHAAQIYALLCPIAGDIRYIGKANNAAKRLASHKRDARMRRTPVYDWMNKLKADGLEPILIVLEEADDWATSERQWIAAAREADCRLLNLADGGDQPKSNPEQLRRAAATMNAKRPHNVMIAMRIMEGSVRSAGILGDEAVEHAKARLSWFKDVVATVRQAGWLCGFDKRLGERRPQLQRL
jgi:hypothetical protein